MGSDLVGAVIPAYIGALSSVAGVVVAIVALVTSRRARADARSAAAASDRVAEREKTVRAAVVELAQLARQQPAPVTAAPTVRAVPSAPQASERKEAASRRPHWAPKPGADRTAPPAGTGTDDRADVQRRLQAIIRGLSDEG